MDAKPSLHSIRFYHSVGKSTIAQGFTIPVSAQVGWIARIEKGQTVPVRLRFGDAGVVMAQIRRLNNSRGHVQFRYEGRSQRPFREYLKDIFHRDMDGVLKIEQVADAEFLVQPQPPGVTTLSIYKPRLHNIPDNALANVPELSEISQLFRQIPYSRESGQSEYNALIKSLLTSAGWNPEMRVREGIGLRCDFEKNGVWVEVEFGNARVYYQDYVKFLLAARYQRARCGVLLCPTEAFAQLLCDLGRERAAAKRTPTAGTLPAYSGMMSYEKAAREFPHLRFMLTNAVIVAGIELERHNPGLLPDGIVERPA